MKNLIKIIIVLVFLIGCRNQTRQSNKLNYKIFQYKEKDSLNGHISKIVKFNNKHLISYEKYIDYFEDGCFRTEDKEITYNYKDTLLISEITKYTINFRQDSSRVDYLYNDKGALVKKIYNKHYRPFKKGRPDGCLVDSSDFEPKLKWGMDYTEYYKFKNKKIVEKRIPNFVRSEIKYQYEYDKKERIIKEIYYFGDELVSEKKYEYIENGYNLSSKGNWNGFEKYRFIKDRKGNIIQERKEWKKKQIYRIEKKYDIKNRIILEQRYDDENKLELTYKYIYK